MDFKYSKTEVNLDIKKLKPLFDLIKKWDLHKEPEKTLVQEPCYDIELLLNNVYLCFANTIRRYLINNILCYRIKINNDTFECDDEYVDVRVLSNEFSQIPINQSTFSENKDYTIELNMKNSGVETKFIMSDDFIIKKKNKQIPIDGLIPKNIIIMALRSGKYIKTGSLQIVSDIGLSNRSFAITQAAPSMTYDILEEVKETKSSGNIDADKTDSVQINFILDRKNIVIKYRTYPNYDDPDLPLILFMRTINSDINEIKQDIEIVKRDYSQDRTSIEGKRILLNVINNDTINMEIKNDGFTLANLYCDYIKIMFPDIVKIRSTIVHPNIKKGLLTIGSNDFNIITKVSDKILEDYNFMAKKIGIKY